MVIHVSRMDNMMVWHAGMYSSVASPLLAPCPCNITVWWLWCLMLTWPIVWEVVSYYPTMRDISPCQRQSIVRTHAVMIVIINRVNRVSVHSAPYITSPPDDYEICIRILLAAFGHNFTMRLFYWTSSCGQFFILLTLNLKITPAHFTALIYIIGNF